MAKKTLDFDNPLLAAADPEPEKPKRGRPRREDLIRTENGGPSVQAGLPPELRRFTAIVKTDNWNDMMNYAYTHRITVKDTLDEILEDFFTRYRKNPKNEPLLDRNERKARKNAKK